MNICVKIRSIRVICVPLYNLNILPVSKIKSERPRMKQPMLITKKMFGRIIKIKLSIKERNL
jgi:hypothetical protein